MIVRHEFRLSGTCPVDQQTTDHYDVVVETNRFLPVETIVEAADHAVLEPRYQEEIARLLANRYGVGVTVTLVGVHSGVKTTAVAGPAWENELEVP